LLYVEKPVDLKTNEMKAKKEKYGAGVMGAK
jgi:hypothetical protein